MLDVFPQSDRVELQNPPLELVVCQIRFPTILALAGDRAPEEFQKKISKRYPVAQRQQKRVDVRTEQEGAILQAGSLWCFDDKDSEWTVSLRHDSLTLETKRYKRFADFIERFDWLLKQARSVYPIEMRTRLGLRYVDRISRVVNPVLPEDWWQEANQDVIPLRARRCKGSTQQVKLETRFNHDREFLAIRSMFVDRSFPGFEGEELILDFDRYTEGRSDIGDVPRTLGGYKEACYRAFRWAVGDLIKYFDRAEKEEGGA